MNKYKIGDKVILIDNSFVYDTNIEIGDVARIVSNFTSAGTYHLKCDKWGVDTIPVKPCRFKLYKEEKEMKYKIIKSFSLKSLKDAGACQQELGKAALLLLSLYNSWAYETIIPYDSQRTDDIINIAKQCKGGIEFLIEKGFIAKEEKLYTFGSVFMSDKKNKCVLVRISDTKAKIVDIEGNTFWGKASLDFSKREPKWTWDEIESEFCLLYRIDE